MFCHSFCSSKSILFDKIPLSGYKHEAINHNAYQYISMNMKLIIYASTELLQYQKLDITKYTPVKIKNKK